MSIIQDIRDKYAKVTVVLIALALLGFILTDYFSGKARASRGGGSNSIGHVNGKSINYNYFSKRVQQTEANMVAQGYPQSSSLSQQALDQTWKREVESMILNDEFDKLGIRVGKKELGDILYGANAPADLKNQFKDEKTGQFNAALAKQNIDQMLKRGTAEQKENINNYVNQLADQRMTEKLTSLLANSVNYPRWFIEKQNADNSQIAKISMVKEAYASIPDSTVKVDDKELADYISKHKKDFKQEESRSISYVTFSAAPNAADSQATIKRLLDLKPQFDSTKDVEEFLAGEGVNNYYKSFISGKTIQIKAKDSIFKTPVGGIYGPYLDGNNFVLAKMEGIRQMPDTVKVRHILIGTSTRDPQTGQFTPTRDTISAYKLADSLRNAIAKGTNFDSLVVKFSDDGSKDKGGIYDNVPSGQMVAPFNDFIFLNPVGYKGIVKTEFGYHYVEILSQKGGGPAYKIAYLSKEIVASQETDNAASERAYTFAGDSHDEKAFNENYDKKIRPAGQIKGVATNIKPIDAEINGLGNSRSFVRTIFDAKRGEVLKPERIGENYVVAVVTEILEEGTQSPVKARGTRVESDLRNKKKAAILKQKIGKVTTLEAAAAALGGKPIEAVDSIRMNTATPLLGYEPRVIGAAFNPANKGKIVPEVLEGGEAVYVIRVENTSATAVTEGNVADQRKMRYQQMKGYVSNPNTPFNPLSILKNAATITDNRAKKY
jgi:peptidyl-prolyl cis-trans isomerase D